MTRITEISQNAARALCQVKDPDSRRSLYIDAVTAADGGTPTEWDVRRAISKRKPQKPQSQRKTKRSRSRPSQQRQDRAVKLDPLPRDASSAVVDGRKQLSKHLKRVARWIDEDIKRHESGQMSLGTDGEAA